MKRRLAYAGAVVVVTALTACQRLPQPTPQELATVNTITSKLKTRCVGRYLIDVPADAALFGTLDVQGVSIEAKPMSLDDYRKAMNARSEELRSAKSLFGYRFLYNSTDIKGIPDSRYFVSLGKTYEGTDSTRLIEAYRWDRGYQIGMKIEGDDAKHSVYFKDDPVARDAPYMNDAAAKSQLLVSLLSRARGRPDDEIPGEPGVCFQGGFLRGEPWPKESVTFQVVPAHHDDVSFDLETDSNLRETTSLLERGHDINELFRQAHARTLRKGVVELRGMHAEEWLASGPTVLDVPGFMFSLEANSKNGSPRAPLTTLQMDVGAPNRVFKNHDLKMASLTEAEAINVWDIISRTLRPRPNAF
jgi:hypothetical protein